MDIMLSQIWHDPGLNFEVSPINYAINIIYCIAARGGGPMPDQFVPFISYGNTYNKLDITSIHSFAFTPFHSG
jgi:hypothetical protein